MRDLNTYNQNRSRNPTIKKNEFLMALFIANLLHNNNNFFKGVTTEIGYIAFILLHPDYNFKKGWKPISKNGFYRRISRYQKDGWILAEKTKEGKKAKGEYSEITLSKESRMDVGEFTLKNIEIFLTQEIPIQIKEMKEKLSGRELASAQSNIITKKTKTYKNNINKNAKKMGYEKDIEKIEKLRRWFSSCLKVNEIEKLQRRLKEKQSKMSY